MALDKHYQTYITCLLPSLEVEPEVVEGSADDNEASDFLGTFPVLIQNMHYVQRLKKPSGQTRRVAQGPWKQTAPRMEGTNRCLYTGTGIGRRQKCT